MKYAREHGSYTDHTGNLRNSIGYVVVQYGRIIAESFKYNRRVRPDGNPKGNKGADEAHAKGLEHARSVARELPANKTYLVWVAGMEYAKYVEAKGFDVLEGSGNWVESTAEKLKAEFARFLKSKSDEPDLYGNIQTRLGSHPGFAVREDRADDVCGPLPE